MTRDQKIITGLRLLRQGLIDLDKHCKDEDEPFGFHIAGLVEEAFNSPKHGSLSSDDLINIVQEITALLGESEVGF